MVDKDDRLFFINCIRYGIEPDHALSRKKRRGHTHIRAAVGTYEFYALAVEFELLISENLHESIASAFRPFRIMVAGYDIIGFVQPVDNGFCEFYLLVRAEFGNIARDNDKREFIIFVNVIYAGLQVLYAGRPFRDMRIGKISEFELLRKKRHRNNRCND